MVGQDGVANPRDSRLASTLWRLTKGTVEGEPRVVPGEIRLSAIGRHRVERRP